MEDRFAAIYCSNGRNASGAYHAIYPRASEPTCRAEGCKYLAKPSVQEKITRLTNEALKRDHMGADEALSLTARLGRLNLQDYYWQPGELDRSGSATTPGQRKPLHELTPDQARMIAGFKRTKFGEDMLLRDADKALEHILRHHKLLTDKVEMSGADGQPIELRWAGEGDARD
jgi:hypothetical protein